ncbi:MAG: hypothetical protein WCA20_13850, partial [Candidatus Sulfotelmatobacter sp.]
MILPCALIAILRECAPAGPCSSGQNLKQLQRSLVDGSLGSSVQGFPKPLGGERLEHIVDRLLFEGSDRVFFVRSHKDDRGHRAFVLLK